MPPPNVNVQPLKHDTANGTCLEVAVASHASASGTSALVLHAKVRVFLIVELASAFHRAEFAVATA